MEVQEERTEVWMNHYNTESPKWSLLG